MNVRLVASLAAGALFGAGLALSGMTDPRLVLAFLDVAGAFDPTLAFVLGGAVAVTVPGYRFVLRRAHPRFDTRFHVPDNRRIDLRLVAGGGDLRDRLGHRGLLSGPGLGRARGRREDGMAVRARDDRGQPAAALDGSPAFGVNALQSASTA